MDLFKLAATITMNDSEFREGIENAQKSGKKLTQTNVGIGSSLDKMVNKGLKWAGVGMSAFGISAIKTASDLTEVQNVVDTVFGNMSSDVDTWAKKSIRQFGLSELQAKQFTGTLGALITSSGVSGEKMKEMAINLTGLTADFASFYNLGHEEAFEKIKSGISGEIEPLKALGINMSVANMEAYALAQGIKKPWKEMSQAEQTMLRYNFIMEKGSMASGDFAKTLDTSLANQLRVAKNETIAMAGEIGTKFLPIVTETVKWVRENGEVLGTLGSVALGTLVALKGYTTISTIITLLKAFRAGTLKATLAQMGLNAAMWTNPITWIIALIGALVGAIIYLWNTNEGFRQFWINAWNGIKEAVGDALNGVKNFFNETLPNTLQNVKDWATNIKDSVADWTSNTINNVKGWVGSVGDKLTNFFNNSKNKMSEFGQSFKESWNNILSNLKNFPNYAKEKFGEFIGVAKNFIKNGVDKIKTNFGNMAIFIKGKINDMIYMIKNLPDIMYKIGYAISYNIISAIKNAVISITTFFTVTIPNAFNNFIVFIQTKISEFGTWLAALPETIYNFYINALGKFTQFTKGIGQMIKNFIVQTWNDFVTWGNNLVVLLGEKAQQMLNNFVQWISQIPTKVATFIGDTWNKFATWGSNMITKAKNIASSVLNSLINYFSQLPSRIWNWVSNTFNKVVTWGSNMISKAKDIGRQFTEWLINSIKELPSMIANIGRDIVRGLWNGITGMGGWLMDNVKSFFSGIVDGAKSALGIHSPSRVMRDQVGKFMAMGVGVGFTDQMDKVNKEIQNSIAIPNVPSMASLREDSRREDHSNLINAIMSLVNRPAKFEIDGREVMIALAPHQDEFTDYNKIHNVSWA